LRYGPRRWSISGLTACHLANPPLLKPPQGHAVDIVHELHVSGGHPAVDVFVYVNCALPTAEDPGAPFE
jgi:hypothetical protein